MADDPLTQSAQFSRTSSRRMFSNDIGNANFKNLRFDKASGGTLTLGGKDNGNGVLAVDDDTGTEKITLDKDGLTIRDGKITIENDAGTTSIDSKGIVSTANFVRADSTNGGLNQNVTATSFVDVTGATLSFTLTRSTIVLVLFSCGLYLVESVGNTADGQVRVKEDLFVTDSLVNINSGNNHLFTQGTHYLTSMSSGSHTIKLIADLSNKTGSPNMTIATYLISYLILGT